MALPELETVALEQGDDGVLVEDSQFDNAFPYLTTPLAGSPNGSNGLPANPVSP